VRRVRACSVLCFALAALSTRAATVDEVWLELGRSGSPRDFGMGLPGSRYRVLRYSGAAWMFRASSAADSRGRVFVAWVQDNRPDSPASKLRILVWGGSEWQEIDGSPPGAGASPTEDEVLAPDLILDAQERPVVAWAVQRTPDDLFLGAAIRARRWGGTAWQDVIPGSSSGEGISQLPAESCQYPHLMLDASGEITATWGFHSNGMDDYYAVRLLDGRSPTRVYALPASRVSGPEFISRVVSGETVRFYLWTRATGNPAVREVVVNVHGTEYVFPSPTVGAVDNSGHPVVAVNDEMDGREVSRLYRLDGTQWAEIAVDQYGGRARRWPEQLIFDVTNHPILLESDARRFLISSHEAHSRRFPRERELRARVRPSVGWHGLERPRLRERPLRGCFALRFNHRGFRAGCGSRRQSGDHLAVRACSSLECRAMAASGYPERRFHSGARGRFPQSRLSR
jgi:hypothetical protein